MEKKHLKSVLAKAHAGVETQLIQLMAKFTITLADLKEAHRLKVCAFERFEICSDMLYRADCLVYKTSQWPPDSRVYIAFGNTFILEDVKIAQRIYELQRDDLADNLNSIQENIAVIDDNCRANEIKLSIINSAHQELTQKEIDLRKYRKDLKKKKNKK